MAETAKLVVDGKTLELPIVVGSEGERGIDITQLRAKTGYITLDPGYANTGSCKSAITFIDGEKGILRYRGIPIEQLAEKSSFLEVAYLLVYGNLPTPKQLDDFVNSIEDQPCGCGRTLPRIRSFEGRTADIMFTADGSPVGVLDTIFDVDMPIREAQIIQESLHSIRVRVVPGRGFGDHHRRSLARGVRMRMGPHVEVPIETVESIPRTKAGKFRVQVSMLDDRTRLGSL